MLNLHWVFGLIVDCGRIDDLSPLIYVHHVQKQHSFDIFQGDVSIHMIYKSAGQEELKHLFSGKMMPEYLRIWMSSLHLYKQNHCFVLCVYVMLNTESVFNWTVLNTDRNVFCFLGVLPEPPFPSPPFPGSKVVHWRKKRQVRICCECICCKGIAFIKKLMDWLSYCCCSLSIPHYTVFSHSLFFCMKYSSFQ